MPMNEIKQKQQQQQNDVTSNSNSPRVLLFDLAHLQCNGFFSIKRIYMFSQTILQNKLIKKIKQDII